MSDETEQDPTTEAPEAVTTDTQPSKKGKVFTQDEVNAIVAKEKEAARKAANREKEALTAVEANLRDDLAFYEEQVGTVIDAQVADFDPVTLELFKALPIREQLAKLSDEAFMGKVRRKNVIPVTPTTAGESKPIFKRRTSV